MSDPFSTPPVGQFGPRPEYTSAGAPGAGPVPPQPKKGRKVRKAKAPKADRGRRAAKVSDTDPVTRQSNRALRAGVVTALVFGVLAMLVLSAPQETDLVVRASEDISAYAVVSVDQFQITALPPAAIEEGAISGKDRDELVAQLEALIAESQTRELIRKDSQIHPSMFSTTIDLNVPLAPGERLVSIEADITDAVNGSISPGDRVDIIAVDRDGTASVILSDVEVIHVSLSSRQFDEIASSQTGERRGSAAGELVPARPLPGSYVLRINGSDATVLLSAADQARLWLLWRDPSDTGLLFAPTLTLPEALCAWDPGALACAGIDSSNVPSGLDRQLDLVDDSGDVNP
jgi:Flp pilus assembly protein CpaB